MDADYIQTLLERQAAEIVSNLATENLSADPQSQLVALIAYLQKIGQSEDISYARVRLETAAPRAE